MLLEGRAWIDPATFEVLRLESEPEEPVAAIGLTREHLTIEYEPVTFRATSEEIWLPKVAEVYMER